MKYLFSFSMSTMLLFFAFSSCAQQDKSKRPSPPASVTQKVGTVTININYSQPSIKDRTIGKDIEPMEGKVWRTGANEATVFEIDNDVMIEGNALPKGKYGLFTLVNGDYWTFIFNKTWDQWGANKYKEADDVLRIKIKAVKADGFAEKMNFTIDENGQVTLFWGDVKVGFTVK